MDNTSHLSDSLFPGRTSDAKLIDIELGDGQRMRRVVSRSNQRVTGKYPSWKRACMAYWESTIERDAFRRLDADSSVLVYEEQPAKITYYFNGKTLTHYPDVLVTWNKSQPRCFLEVKTDRDADTADVRERTAIMVALLRQAGFGYRVWRESEIRVQPRLDNDTYLLTWGRRPVPGVQREKVRRLFAEATQIPWDVLTKKVLGTGGTEQAARLVLEGMLVVDRSVPLTSTSMVSLNEATGSAS